MPEGGNAAIYKSAYSARQTARVAAARVIYLLFTPIRSPQSNGVLEAFVKTLKRTTPRPSSSKTQTPPGLAASMDRRLP